MIDPPPEFGLLNQLEAPKPRAMRGPDFVCDLSGNDLRVFVPDIIEVHGSYLVERHDALLFGSNHLIFGKGYWANESRKLKQQWLHYLQMPFYNVIFPGDRPVITMSEDNTKLDVSRLAHSQSVRIIEEPVFLATPQEAPIWGSWICTVFSKAIWYKKHGQGRKFMCHVQHAWQRNTLNFLGIKNEDIMPHDPGATYICRDLMTVEYSDTDLKISDIERDFFRALIINNKLTMEIPDRIFVSRFTRSKINPNYRTLLNEVELARGLKTLGFTVIEPEYLPLSVQINLFSRTREIVFLGGSAIYNAVFCRPDAKIVTIESSSTYINGHASYFSSLNLDYGVVFGREDPSAPEQFHRRWTLDVNPILTTLLNYF